ncbi:hypothetical protein Tco_0842809 [Tanacetum coccineum]|uniref:Uncharacterized protein n=1 Tax=Tanacetum coccineum TaxID=301880 RepID=A0ABQ5B318_9ASTR
MKPLQRLIHVDEDEDLYRIDKASGASGAFGTTGASDSAQAPPPPPPVSSTRRRSDLSTGTLQPESIARIPDDLHMDEDTTADVQVLSSDDEVGRDHVPTENSLLAQTEDMATFMDWFCKQRGISELTPKDLEGPAFEIIKVFHPDVIHLQFQMEECHKLLTDQVDDASSGHGVSNDWSQSWPDCLVNLNVECGILSDVGLEQLAMYGISSLVGSTDNDSTLTTPFSSDRSPPEDTRFSLTTVKLWTRNLVYLTLVVEGLFSGIIENSPKGSHIQEDSYGVQDDHEEFSENKGIVRTEMELVLEMKPNKVLVMKSREQTSMEYSVWLHISMIDTYTGIPVRGDSSYREST